MCSDKSISTRAADNRCRSRRSRHFNKSVGAATISHLGQVPSVTISFNLAPGVSLGEAVERIDGAVSKIDMPDTITGSFQGTAQAFQSSISSMGSLLLFAVCVIYLVLGILYESFIHPLTILFGVAHRRVRRVADAADFSIST